MSRQPKNAAKESAKAKAAPKANGAVAANGAAKGQGGRGGRKSGRAGRPKKKTAEELDAEMSDYFGTGEAPPTNGAVQPSAAAAGGDTGMVDEVM